MGKTKRWVTVRPGNPDLRMTVDGCKHNLPITDVNVWGTPMHLSDAEWILMNAVWDAAGRVTAADVVAAVAVDNGWSEATVKTMLHRLVRKKALRTRKVGKHFEYAAAVRRTTCRRRASRSFLDRVFGDRTPAAMLNLVESANLSDDDVRELRRLLDRKLRTSADSSSVNGSQNNPQRPAKDRDHD